MGKALNRGKVVGPVPWPLWPYVRGTGRAGMGHTPPLNLGVVGESMWSPASRSQATLYRNLTRLEHAGPPGPRGRQGQRTRARRAGARQGPRDGQTERGKAQSRARPQDFFKMFSVFCRRRRGRASSSLQHREPPHHNTIQTSASDQTLPEDRTPPSPDFHSHRLPNRYSPPVSTRLRSPSRAPHTLAYACVCVRCQCLTFCHTRTRP